MSAEIEVELRGRLRQEQYDTLLGFLRDKGEFKEHKHRLLIDYSTFLPGEGVAERTRDIRLRITNGVPEIITKLGGWGGDEHRQEISIKTEPGSFDRLVETYGVLGYTKAIVAERFSEVFEYRGFEFALVTVPNHSYYVEIEKMAHDSEDMARVKEEIRAVCAELSIVLFDDTGFFDYIEALNRESNDTFDFANFEPNYFAKRYTI
jgi:adenylate cyclase class IV